VSSDALRRYYRLHAPIYDATRWAFLFGRTRLIQLLSRAFAGAAYAGVACAGVADAGVAPKQILDLGCGTGKNLCALANAFPQAQITGVDLSPAMLAQAGRNLVRKLDPAARARISLRNTDIAQMPTLQYDLIVCSYMLSMTGSQLPELLQKLRSLLTPTGRLAIVDFDSTWAQWFARWMSVNHVRMDGTLAACLKTFSHTELHEQHSGLGLWRWLIWIGR